MQQGQRYFLKKEDRLKSSKLIETLFSKGSSFSNFPFKVTWMPMPEGLQAGFGAGSRNFKRAVDRNRIKRLMREAYRLQKHILSGHLQEHGIAVFILYTGKELPAYDLVYEKIGIILSRLIKFINEKDPVHT
jgi:ribonuclease P protein component